MRRPGKVLMASKNRTAVLRRLRVLSSSLAFLAKGLNRPLPRDWQEKEDYYGCEEEGCVTLVANANLHVCLGRYHSAAYPTRDAMAHSGMVGITYLLHRHVFVGQLDTSSGGAKKSTVAGGCDRRLKSTELRLTIASLTLFFCAVPNLICAFSIRKPL